ncbi:hypothetical protein M885DRAFT_15428 [Pelagophyceae sp. CCMP2097]|nr:hypothetical protein M885DRAFT_15428 [Pelagophyceae sp. CCMP2097]
MRRVSGHPTRTTRDFKVQSFPARASGAPSHRRRRSRSSPTSSSRHHTTRRRTPPSQTRWRRRASPPAANRPSSSSTRASTLQRSRAPQSALMPRATPRAGPPVPRFSTQAVAVASRARQSASLHAWRRKSRRASWSTRRTSSRSSGRWHASYSSATELRERPPRNSPTPTAWVPSSTSPEPFSATAKSRGTPLQLTWQTSSPSSWQAGSRGDSRCGYRPRSDNWGCRHYAGMDVLVNPSLRAWSETFCIANIEAMALGVPVVSFGVGGVGEYLRGGGGAKANGALVNSTAPEALADAVVELLRDAVLRRRLGANARRTVLESFHVDDQIRKYADLYTSLSEARR